VLFYAQSTLEKSEFFQYERKKKKEKTSQVKQKSFNLTQKECDELRNC